MKIQIFLLLILAAAIFFGASNLPLLAGCPPECVEFAGDDMSPVAVGQEAFENPPQIISEYILPQCIYESSQYSFPEERPPAA